MRGRFVFSIKRTAKQRPSKDAAVNPLEDEQARSDFGRIMSAIGKPSADSMTAEAKSARGKAGAVSRSSALTPEQRKSLAKAAATARWKKNKPQD